MTASGAGRLLRAAGALALLASAVLPGLRDGGGAAQSWLSLLRPSVGAGVMATALLLLSFPYLFAAMTAGTVFVALRDTGRGMAMTAVAVSLLACGQAMLSGLLLAVASRGRLGFALVVLAGIVGIVGIRGAIRRGEGDLGRTARAALLAGAAVVILWFMVLYVDEHTPGALVGLGGALAVLAGGSLDRTDPA